MQAPEPKILRSMNRYVCADEVHKECVSFAHFFCPCTENGISCSFWESWDPCFAAPSTWSQTCNCTRGTMFILSRIAMNCSRCVQWIGFLSSLFPITCPSEHTRFFFLFPQDHSPDQFTCANWMRDSWCLHIFSHK